LPMAWSPDGRWVAFTDQDVRTGVVGGLYLVSQRGGAPRRVAAGTLTTGGFVAPDTLVLTTPYDTLQHWLRRVVVSSSAVVDSAFLPIGGYVFGVTPSPSGARLLVQTQNKLLFDFMTDSSTVSIVDRTGRATDSLRVAALGSVVWAGGK
jgi:Tol biopolymer transport system component